MWNRHWKWFRSNWKEISLKIDKSSGCSFRHIVLKCEWHEKISIRPPAVNSQFLAMWNCISQQRKSMKTSVWSITFATFRNSISVRFYDEQTFTARSVFSPILDRIKCMLRRKSSALSWSKRALVFYAFDVTSGTSEEHRKHSQTFFVIRKLCTYNEKTFFVLRTYTHKKRELFELFLIIRAMRESLSIFANFSNNVTRYRLSSLSHTLLSICLVGEWQRKGIWGSDKIMSVERD